MVRYKVLCLFSALLILFLGLPASSLAQKPTTAPDTPAFAPGEVLVKFKPGLGVQDTRQRVAGLQVSKIERIPAVEAERLHVPPGRELDVIAKLQARADVEYVEPNYIAHALDIPNDPSFSSQWGLTKIGLPQTLDITGGSSDTIIAIIDTGIDLDHPDLSCLVGPGLSKLTPGWNFVSNNSNPDDDSSHGTHVAGIAAACTDNYTGVSGVAPNARLMPVKVLDSAGSGTYAGVASGIIYAADNGADIINLSLGGASGSNTLANAVQYAVGRGVMVVAASGNAGVSALYYPAAYPEVMAVGATDAWDNRAYFSNYGPGLDVVAPGNSIYSTWSWGTYGYKSGTSMATPHVAGLAALIQSMNPTQSPAEIRQTIQSTADDLGSAGYDTLFGYGRINAYRALESYMVISLLQTSGLEQTEPVSFLIDDQLGSPLPATYTFEVTTTNPQMVDWQAALPPDATWLSIVSPNSGQISAFSFDQVTLAASRPSAYGVYTTRLTVTGATPSGAQLGPVTADIKLTYMPDLYRLQFPVLFRN